MTPVAISNQNARSTSRRDDDAPGDFIGDRPVNSCIHPDGLPINTSTIEVLRRPVEFTQYTSIAYTGRLDDIGAAPSIGTVGDSFDNAMAETTIGLFKTELHRNPAALRASGGHWRGLDDLEIGTCGWVSWFNQERFHGELGDLTPAEVEAAYYLHKSQPEAA